MGIELLLFILSIISSVLNGLTSIGGGILFFYGLIFVYQNSMEIGVTMQYLATVVMFFSLASTSTGSIYYYKKRLYDHTTNWYFGSGAFIGGFIGSLLANSLSNEFLKIIFFLVTIFASIASFIKPAKASREKKLSFKWYVLFGILIGVLGGIYGIGLGFLFLPVMTLIYRMPVKQAVGSSLFCGMLLIVGALFGKIGTPYVNWKLAFIAATGGVLGTLLGGWLSVKVVSSVLRIIISVVLAIIGITFLADALINLFGQNILNIGDI